MILTCPACQNRYLVPDHAVGPAGRQVRCAACKHSWLARPDQPNIDQSGAEQPSPMPSSPTPSAPTPDGTSPASQSLPDPSPIAPASPMVETFAGEPVAATPAAYQEWAEEPPFRPRRNSLRLLTWAASLFALLALGGVVALLTFGTGDLSQRIGLVRPEVPLVIEVTRQPERRTLDSGNELLTVSGRIVNPTSRTQSVPDIHAELRDKRGRSVYGWTINRPVRQLAPGAKADFDTAAVDIPRGARDLDLSFADGTDE